MERYRVIPKVLRVLHGERARPRDLLLTYVAAAITVVIVVLRPSTRPAAVAWWEIAIVVNCHEP
ncbi:MAG: hypothetical protein ACOC1I_08990 [Spirochaetota bacterium]